MSKSSFIGYYINCDSEEVKLSKSEFCSRFCCLPSQLSDPSFTLFFNEYYEFDHGKVYGRIDGILYGGWYFERI